MPGIHHEAVAERSPLSIFNRDDLFREEFQIRLASNAFLISFNSFSCYVL